MNILVTGACGNIGTKLCKYLSERGHNLLRTDILPGFDDDYLLADINNPLALLKAFEINKPDIVFHLAAIYGRLANELYAAQAVQTNITGTNNIIQLCKNYNSKLIFFSTSEVYGNIGGILKEDRIDLSPNNRYGKLKLFAEELITYEVREHGLKALILRPNMIYSENESFGEFRSAMIRFVETLLKGEKITVYTDSRRSWLYIDEAVKIFEACMIHDKFDIINITHPTVVPTINVAKLICRELDINYNDWAIEEKTPHRMTLNKDIDVSKMIKLFGIIPKIGIEEGIKIVINTVKKRLNYE